MDVAPAYVVVPMFPPSPLFQSSPRFQSFHGLPRSIAHFSPVRHEPKDFVSHIAPMFVDLFVRQRELNRMCNVDLVLVGGYAHMARLQQHSILARTIGTWEYGLRDIDLVCVPRQQPTYTQYALDCASVIDQFDALQTRWNKRGQEKEGRWWEMTQASTDFSMSSRKQGTISSVQRMLKTNEYGLTHVWMLDSHQLINITVLSQEHWTDGIEFDDIWLVFPAFKQNKPWAAVFSRPVLPVRVVTQQYLDARLSMQVATCVLTKNVRKHLFLKMRQTVWRSVDSIGFCRRDSSEMMHLKHQLLIKEEEKKRILERVEVTRQEYEELLQSMRERLAKQEQKLKRQKQRCETVERQVKALQKESVVPQVLKTFVDASTLTDTQEPTPQIHVRTVTVPEGKRKKTRTVMCETETCALQTPFGASLWLDVIGGMLSRDFLFLAVLGIIFAVKRIFGQ